MRYLETEKLKLVTVKKDILLKQPIQNVPRPQTGDYKTKTKNQRPKMEDPRMFTTIGSNYS